MDPEIEHRVSLVSAKEGDGLIAFASALAKAGGANSEQAGFSARIRHVQALQKTAACLKDAQASLNRAMARTGAEDCLLAHQTLGEIVGTLTPDELLGEIFRLSVLVNKPDDITTAVLYCWVRVCFSHLISLY